MKYRIKICGITRTSDVKLVSTLGADMIGMIFYRRSPRFVSIPSAKEISKVSSPIIQKVGVFVNEENDRILEIAHKVGLDWVQLHGNESASDINYIKKHHLKVIKAFKIASKSDWNIVLKCRADLVLVDNMKADSQGGTGESFDWAIRPKQKISNLVLAGGLSADNLSEGIKLFKPAMVDLNSGVESSPGIKSAKKLKEIFRLCRRLQFDR